MTNSSLDLYVCSFLITTGRVFFYW